MTLFIISDLEEPEWREPIGSTVASDEQTLRDVTGTPALELPRTHNHHHSLRMLGNYPIPTACSAAGEGTEL